MLTARTATKVLIALNRRCYPLLLKLMFLLPPERIHHIVFVLLRAVSRFSVLSFPVAKLLAHHDPVLRSRVFGVDFPVPIGLAAGFDKTADAVNAWGQIGFGFAEIGTITGQGQPGNPRPRLFRLPADRALINRMGFNNPGAHVAAEHLKEVRRGPVSAPIGANIGKTKVVPLDEAIDDYRLSAGLLGPLADFVVVNVSSPNTPGLRDLQAVDSLRPILAAVQAEVHVPVLVKIAPDLVDDDIDAVADLAVELGLAGIVATNTTIGREGLRTPDAEVREIGAGGLSGAPLADRSLAVLKRLYNRVGGKIAIVSVGGIETVDQAWERICAGADLLQVYTGFIYGGPLWLYELHSGLAERVRAGGFASISDAVGCAAAQQP
ncbi:dihydroorotate dehydrogenase (quinone) [Gordonia sp. CNJ-863]|uniref:Dihydroorotate dehydrogenase (quinone) n=1 Tax=Gordonia alkanivorans NBRC 16433 TaxID=1027371 RepID=F9W0H1_9ACTN|nr:MULTISPECIES: quinone-dependent dihydroorotate dehydrogenase [Gordonia]MDH3023516.1 quinone-dependent dihydroorotate dehydrogenase [Gordonia alkanivorans]MDH3044201.1 quinone-dependent dihydroorotate dehydrogenase [Gordonia alkanivorans]MDJ0008907.1 quinone-dependent dihydroorotate dehydrogenase [Gordonia alkanivorans]MDJ0098150.1 quinone-dependent dihydroorotate dehydrogenase [Gordonia alkanivorans]MDJ0494482.1 quinone-dependent dihydroorotate dehydrogenase [Gordonia alkanivorans]